MKVPGLRSPHERVGNIVYFGRMLDKIRLKAKGVLPPGYNTGTDEWYDFDSRCTRFLRVKYASLQKRTLRGGSDEALLRWCFLEGRWPSAEEIEIWNTFMMKRGWNDSVSAGLEESKRACGLSERKDIVTFFQLFDADEA
jgi:gluconokinase